MGRRVFPSWLAVLTVRLWAITLGLMVGWFGFTELAATALPEPSPAKPIQLTTTDDAGVGSLRWAITQANASPDDDVIAFDEIQGEILLHSPLPAIATNLTLMGNGNDAISGGGRHRVLQVDGGSVVIRDLTLADGLARGDDGFHGGGGGAGMGGGLLIHRGTVRISQTRFINNQAVGGSGSRLPLHIQTQDNQLEVNRGAIAGIAGIGFSATAPPAPMPEADISRTQATIRANRGAIAGVSGIGINGIGTIAFGGGGGFGGFGNAGNGGNGGNGGTDSGNGGNGGNGGDGGVGIFGSFARWEDQGSIGTIAFGGGGGFGGFGNAGNGGNGGNATVAIASGGNGGDGGNGGFGGGGGAGGFGGTGGTVGRPGQGGFGGGTGDVGYGGSGGGLGGAIFIRSGSLLLNQVSFERNAAIAGPGPAPGQGKGGAIFISPGPATPENPETQQPSPQKPPKVWLLGKPPTFLNNTATDAAELPTDNNNIFGPVSQRS